MNLQSEKKSCRSAVELVQGAAAVVGAVAEEPGKLYVAASWERVAGVVAGLDIAQVGVRHIDHMAAGFVVEEAAAVVVVGEGVVGRRYADTEAAVVVVDSQWVDQPYMEVAGHIGAAAVAAGLVAVAGRDS